MPFQFFKVLISDDGRQTQAFNHFLASHRIGGVKQEWVANGDHSEPVYPQLTPSSHASGANFFAALVMLRPVMHPKRRSSAALRNVARNSAFFRALSLSNEDTCFSEAENYSDESVGQQYLTGKKTSIRRTTGQRVSLAFS